MDTKHKVIIDDSRSMHHIPNKSVHLMITSPPYPMIEMWDNMFMKQDLRIKNEFEKFDVLKTEEEKLNRNKSQFTKDERDIWFSQTWDIKGAKQVREELQRRAAEFPDEVVYRLIRMFSCESETVLDPFLGTGTTTKVAKETNRNSVGYEIDEELLPIIKQKIGFNQRTLNDNSRFEVISSSEKYIYRIPFYDG